MIDIEEVKHQLKEMLSEERYIHSLNTQKIAAFLSQHYVVNSRQVKIAAILHDCAKELSDDSLKDYLKNYEIILDEIERNEKRLWHASVGAIIARERFNITDRDILRAIKIHPTLDKNPSTLDKIIYVADYMDSMKTKGEEKSYERLRNIAITELDIVTFWILNFKILDIMKYRGIIHPRSIEVRNNLINNLQEKMRYYNI